MSMQAQRWSVSALSVETGFTRRAIARALTDLPPVEIRGRAKLYRMRDALPLLYGRASRGIDLAEQRARQHKETADKIEMENKVRRTELVDGNEIAALWEGLAIEIRQRLLTIPARVAANMVKVRTQRDAKHALETELLGALESLSEGRAGVARRA